MQAIWIMNNLPLNPYNYRESAVIVTGGGQGIGRCIALSYAASGAEVMILDHNRKAGMETKAMIEALFCLSASHITVDMGSEPCLQAVMPAISQWLGERGLDVLVNNAAIADAHRASLKDCGPQSFERVLAVNLTGPYVITQKLLPWLAKKQGSVINLGSTRAVMSEADSEGYAASKGGIVSLTHAMAISLAGCNVRVNCISPGWIATWGWQEGAWESEETPMDPFTAEEHKQHPSGRIGRPSDIASACLFLTSQDAGFINGVNLTIDGGMTRKMIYI